MSTPRMLLALGLFGWLAGLTAVGWELPFVNRGGQIRVTTSPAGAAVQLDGQMQEIAPLTFQRVAPGTHLLVARKEGFREMRRAVSLQQGDKVAAVFKLEPIKGLVVLQTVPPGAEVEIDGAFRGKTPLLLLDLGLGEHPTLIRSEGYQPRKLAIKVADRVPQKIMTDLTSDSAKVSIVSEPAGADVLINGSHRGQTPCAVDRIPSGSIDLEILLKGFRKHQEKIALKAGDIFEVRATLKPLPATLAVQSLPDKARIYLNDQYQGDSPLVLTNLLPGTYRLRAELRGYEADARDMVLKPEDHITEEFRFTRNSGMLVIVTSPPGVQVCVDGEVRGASVPSSNPQVSEPVQVDLLAKGEHILNLIKPGYSYQPVNFTIEQGKILNRTERLTRLFIPNTLVRTGLTADDTHTGVLVRKYPNGDVELETRPGIFKKFDAAHILAIETIAPPGPK
ncbi:MAG: PEGA domain-containing protein [Kiritimatiellaeota bacterium]|nr:PEGA domain-containing protein [Kiritimatiellota bacterium]